MARYRIKEIEYESGKKEYQVQFKWDIFNLFWKSLHSPYDNLSEAKDLVDTQRQKELDKSVKRESYINY